MIHIDQEEGGSAGSPTPRHPIRARGVAHRLRALKPEILALVERILDSGVIEKGPHVAALAHEFQQVCHAPHRPVPCDSGTDALKLALLASGIRNLFAGGRQKYWGLEVWGDRSEQPSITSGRKPYRVASSQAAEKAVGEQLWLPFWPEMPEEDRVYLRTCVREVVDSGEGRRKIHAVAGR